MMTKVRTQIQKEALLSLPGPSGKLEAALSTPFGDVPLRKTWGIVCHPHPLHGGTMYNKVAVALSKTFQRLGVTTIRFNFRGVGQSAGQFGQGTGELDDLLAVIGWALQERPDRDIWLAGFSFGAAIVLKAAVRLPIARLVAVAPPVNHMSLQHLPPLPCPWVLVQGEKDEVVLAQAVYEWAAQCQPAPQILRFPETGHFFHGQLVTLQERLVEALQGEI